MALYRNQTYVRLWASYTLSSLGTFASLVSFPLLVMASSRSPVSVGLISFAGASFMLLALPWAGLLVDRTGWQAVMVRADLVRGIAFGAMTCTVVTHQVTVATVLGVTAVNSALGVPFFAAAATALRATVPAEQLSTALSANQGRAAIVTILGPLAGAALYEVSPALPFAMDAASFLVSAALVATLPTVAATTTGPAGRPSARWTDVTAGWRFLRGHPVLRYMTLNVIVTDFGINGAVVVLVVSASASGDALGTGLITACTGAGNLLGSAVTLPAVRRARPRTLILAATWTGALAVSAIAVTDRVPWGALLAGCFCVATPVIGVLTNRMLLEEVPQDIIGRVQSVFQTVPRLVAATGPVAAGLLLGVLPAPAVLSVFAVPLTALALFSTRTRALRSGPADAAAPLATTPDRDDR
ncbi:MFS transporter [Kitasatospora sp. MAP5-34]|uniref:MFS transporter n=1 Tax=Kitasatospora sp. MAP5-34 TaxID=3035102 RepID=UPI0024737594|nr:MFS transporter [Kitasatospora sp. MAP5-34]